MFGQVTYAYETKITLITGVGYSFMFTYIVHCNVTILCESTSH